MGKLRDPSLACRSRPSKFQAFPLALYSRISFLVNPVRQAVRRAATGTFSLVSATWTIIGLTLLLFVLMEVTVRVRRAWGERGSVPVTFMQGDPRNEPWYADYHKEFEDVQQLSWQSYVYFRRRPHSGREISIDSVGHRVTPQPSTPAVPVARVRMYGGSTMWGEPLRANNTIPAEVARRLQSVAGQGARIEVTNVGETGYVFTQEVLQLFLDLRNGERPNVVVFYDGINDVASAVQRGRAGIPQNEVKREMEFQLGRALDGRSEDSRLARDSRAVGTLFAEMMKRSALVQWAQSRKSGTPRSYIAPDSAIAALLRVYLANARLVESMATQYGFKVLYVWQPTTHTTEKQLDPYEKNLRTLIEADSFQVRVQQIHRQLPAQLDSAMQTIAPGRFVNEMGLFKDDPRPVFVDQTGHNTEAAIPVIVDAFWPMLSRLTTESMQQSPTPVARDRVH